MCCVVYTIVQIRSGNGGDGGGQGGGSTAQCVSLFAYLTVSCAFNAYVTSATDK